MSQKAKDILSYIVIIIVVLLIKKYVFSPIMVDGSSMNPTLHDNDVMILNEIGYYLNGLERFDIIVVKYKNENLVKRVVGFPGETVEFKNNHLYINGELMEENFTHAASADFNLNDIKLEVIPKDCYFVVGDNRINSVDSRIIGVINKKNILGKTKTIIFPFNRFGKVN